MRNSRTFLVGVVLILTLIASDSAMAQGDPNNNIAGVAQTKQQVHDQDVADQRGMGKFGLLGLFGLFGLLGLRKKDAEIIKMEPATSGSN